MTADILPKFAERLRGVRIGFGEATGRPDLAAGDFAKELGLKRATYYRYERGEMEPNLTTLYRILQVTGISLDFLVGGEERRYADQDQPAPVSDAPYTTRLRCAREVKRLTPEQAAAALTVPPRLYERWEDGREPMPAEAMALFGETFSVALSFLRLGRTDELAPALRAQLRLAHPELWQMSAEIVPIASARHQNGG